MLRSIRVTPKKMLRCAVRKNDLRLSKEAPTEIPPTTSTTGGSDDGNDKAWERLLAVAVFLSYYHQS